MKAYRIHAYGNADALKLEEIPTPVPADDQILVKVYAASINHLEIKKTSGAMQAQSPLDFPWIPGYDFAGVVEQTGKTVTAFRPGNKVYGNCHGSYAQYLAVSPSTVVRKPDNLTFIQATSVPHVGETAWQALYTHGLLKAGQKVLIHGAAGAVGAYAVQFTVHAGAKVYGTATGKDLDFVKSLGAEKVIDYKTTDFTTAGKDFDLVLVLVGGDTQERSYNILKKGGRLVSTTGPILEEEAKKHDVTGIAMGIQQSGEDLRKITELLCSGAVKTDVAFVFPLKDAPKGWKIMTGADPSLPPMPHGKIVLEITPEAHDA